MGVGRPKLPIRRPKTNIVIQEPAIIPTQGSEVVQNATPPLMTGSNETRPLMTESNETSHFMMQVLGTVGYSAVYKPTYVNPWAYTTPPYNRLPSWDAQPQAQHQSKQSHLAGNQGVQHAPRSGRLRNVMRSGPDTSHSTPEEAYNLEN